MASVHVSDNVGGHSNLGRDQFRDRDWCATCRRRDWCPRYTTVQKSGRRWYWCDQNGHYGTGVVSIGAQTLHEWSDRIRKLAKKTGGDAHGN